MRNIRIYQPGDYRPGDSVALHEDAGQHLGVVLRKQAGDAITLFRGDNREFPARITSVHKKKVSVIIEAEQTVDRESPCTIHLAQAISKGDRMEWVVQKAVELGVASITPLISERCAIKRRDEWLEKKITQWQAIAVSACEQSGRNTVPLIRAGLDLEAYLATPRPQCNFVLDPQAGRTWRDYMPLPDELSLLIGPEGGLSPQEIERLRTAQYSPLCLGPRVLRTETAALVALSVLQALGGDL